MPLQKAELNTTLHCIQRFTNTCQVTMQVKRDIHVGKTCTQTTNIVYKYMCLCCVESPHYVLFVFQL